MLQTEAQAVLEIAKELAGKNKTLNIERLFDTARRRLKTHPQGLKKLLKHLFENKILVEGSKLIKSEVLENEIRDLIYKFLKKYPGVNFSALKNNLFSEFGKDDMNVGTGQMLWHLGVLLKFEFIVKFEYKNYTLYFPYEMKSEEALFYFLLRDSINRKIIYTIVENEPIKQAEIPEIINELKGTVYYHLNTMKEEKIVFSEKKAGGLEVCINPKKKGLIIEMIGEIEKKLEILKEKYPKKDIKLLKPIEDAKKELKMINPVENTKKIDTTPISIEFDKEPKEKPQKQQRKKEKRERLKSL
ncbi:MAG: hypothetical protein ACFFAO_19355 [Candidatus Hermodarchaeota archaeon]